MREDRPCHELNRQELVERVAKALRSPEMMADTRIPAGRCVLCLSSLSASYWVLDRRAEPPRRYSVAPGSAEEAEVLRLKAQGFSLLELWVAPVRMCPCAERSDVLDEAAHFNRERMRAMTAPTPPPPPPPSGIRGY